MCDVADPWGGSYMMEALTDELYEKAKIIIQEVDESGGMTAYIESGKAKLRIEESATKKQGRIDSSQDVVVGVNKYQLSADDAKKEMIDVLQIDNADVRQKQIARMNEVKANRDEAAAQNALARLEASARTTGSTSQGNDPNNLMALCIECARVRCSLGEMSLALENAWGRHVPATGMVQGAYNVAFNAGAGGKGEKAIEYQDILDKVNAFETEEGRRPRILVAKMGQDGHDRGAKVIASGFADLGFDVDVGPLFQTPREVALQAIDSDVHVIGVSSQAAGHKTLLPALKKELEEMGASHILVVAGGVIPPQDYEFLLKESKSCGAIFGPGTRITDAALKTLQLIPRTDAEHYKRA
jgi:methylmalonyl-CoA mutase